MPNTFTLIASSTVGAGGAASIDFTSIPSTYTDLCLKVSVRSTGVATSLDIALNGSTASFTNKYLQGSGSAASSGSLARYAGLTTGSDLTANTFANCDIYIPNYSGSTNKSFSGDAVQENNATTSYAGLVANLWSNTAAINQITLSNSTGNFAQYSTAYLYGISKS